jgi:hypothetical protein
MLTASAASTSAHHDAGTQLGDLGVGEGVAGERVVARLGLSSIGGESSAGPLLQSCRDGRGAEFVVPSAVGAAPVQGRRVPRGQCQWGYYEVAGGMTWHDRPNPVRAFATPATSAIRHSGAIVMERCAPVSARRCGVP